MLYQVLGEAQGSVKRGLDHHEPKIKLGSQPKSVPALHPDSLSFGTLKRLT